MDEGFCASFALKPPEELICIIRVALFPFVSVFYVTKLPNLTLFSLSVLFVLSCFLSVRILSPTFFFARKITFRFFVNDFYMNELSSNIIDSF